MINAFSRLNFYKHAAGSSHQWHDNPAGAMYVNRFLSNKPAFRGSSSEDTAKIQKTLFLGYIQFPELDKKHISTEEKLFLLIALMAMRWVIKNKFTVYQQDKSGIPYQLTPLTIHFTLSQLENENQSKQFEKKLTAPKNTENPGKGIPASDLQVIDTEVLRKLIKEFQASNEPKVLWQSDIIVLQISDSELDEIIKHLNIKLGINNIYDSSTPLLTNRENFTVTDIICQADYSCIPERADLQFLEEIIIDQLPENEEKLYEFLAQAPQIKKIFFNNNILINKELLLQLKLQQLEVIDVDNNFLTASYIHQLAIQFPTLTEVTCSSSELDLSDYPLSKDELRLVLQNADNLETLYIAHKQNFLSLAAEGKFPFIQQLKKLDFGHTPLSGNDIQQILQSFPSLKTIQLHQYEIDLSNISGICPSAFLALIQSAKNIKTIKFGPFNEALNLAFISSELKASLQEIFFHDSSVLTANDALHFIKQIPTLRIISFNAVSLCLTQEQQISERELALLLEGAREVKSLVVDANTLMKTFNAFNQKIETVTDLIIENGPLTKTEIDVLFQKFPNLEYLTLNLKSSNHNVHTHAAFSQLKGLNLQQQEFNFLQFKEIAKAAINIEKLALCAICMDIKLMITILSQLSKLKELVINWEDMTANQLIELIEGTDHIETFIHSCKVADLREVEYSQETMNKFLDGAWKLVSLKLKSSTQFLKAIENGNIGLENLEEIDFGDNPLTIEQLQHIILIAPKLQRIKYKRTTLLDLRGKKLPPSAIVTLLKNAHFCRKIYFDKDQVTKEVMDILLEKNLPNCEVLDLGNYNDSAEILLKLIKKCSQLKELRHNNKNITLRNSSLSFHEFKILIQGNHKNLSSIELSNCDDYSTTRNTNEVFTCDFPHLSSVSIIFSTTLTNQALNSLLIHSPKLETLDLRTSINPPPAMDPLYGVDLSRLKVLRIMISDTDRQYFDTLMLNIPPLETLEVYYQNNSHPLEYQYFDKLKNLFISGYIASNRKNLLLEKAKNIETLFLKDLNISGSSPILSNPHESLQVLWIVRVSLTAKQLLEFSKNCPRLATIILYETQIVEDEYSESFAAYQSKYSIKVVDYAKSPGYVPSIKIYHNVTEQEQLLLLNESETSSSIGVEREKKTAVNHLFSKNHWGVHHNYNASSIKLGDIGNEAFDFKEHPNAIELDLSNLWIKLERLKEILTDAPTCLERIIVEGTKIQADSQEVIAQLFTPYRVIGKYKLINLSIQKPIDPYAQQTSDANTSFKEQTFHLNRIFYDVAASGSHPNPNSYRLASFNHIALNPNTCTDDAAFVLSNIGNLKLVACPVLEFMNQDVYQHIVNQQQKPHTQCYYAKTSLLLSEHWQAIPSLHANEIITKIHIEPLTEVEIQYSERDNLYYIKHKNELLAPVTIDYLVESTPLTATPSSDISRLVSFFTMHFSAGKLNLGGVSHVTGYEYLLAIAHQKLGACRHRANLFMALVENPNLLASIPELKDLNLMGVKARIIQNDSHKYIEVKENNSWIKYDLGGYPIKININEDTNPLLQKENLQKLEQLKIGKESREKEIVSLLEKATNIHHLAFDISQPLARLMEGAFLEKLTTLDLGNRVLLASEFKALLQKFPTLRKIIFKQCNIASEEVVFTQTYQAKTESTQKIIPLPQIPDYFPKLEKKTEKNALHYSQKLVSQYEPKRLIECSSEQLSGLNYTLQHYCQHTINREYYTVYAADELVLRHPYLELQENEFKNEDSEGDANSSVSTEDNIGLIKNGLNGPLFRFLSKDVPARTLIVDFSQFSASELARFNSLLDEQPSIDGVPLPSGTKVIGLIHPTERKDASLYSRFAGAIEPCAIDASALTMPALFQTTDPEVVIINTLPVDFYGEDNWEAKLLGSWSIKGDKLYFKPGILVKHLEEGGTLQQLILKNPPTANAEFERFFQEAYLRGYIEYEGRRLSWPRPHLKVEKGFTFASKQIMTIERTTLSGNIEMINPSVFPHFLQQYELKVDDQKIGKLFTLKGILGKLARGSSLTLYVSENLSTSQWSQLLAECQERQVQLHIKLAPTVTLPPQLAEKVEVPNIVTIEIPETYSAITSVDNDYCIASTDMDLTVASLQFREPEALNIDVSECFSSELLSRLTGHLNKEQTALEFLQQDGALINLLAERKTVILSGKFSVEMRQWLQDFLYKRKKQVPCLGKVIIVSEQETVNQFIHITPLVKHIVTTEEKQRQLENYQNRILAEQSVESRMQPIDLTQIDSHLPYVIQQARLRHTLADASKLDSWVGLKSDLPVYVPELTYDLSTAEQQSNALDEARLTAVNKTLQASRYVFLAGITGTGKTSFVEDVWRSKEEKRALHVGLDNLDKWAQDRSEGIKAIFIDEANITRDNWTKFESLFRNQPPGMVIDNKYVELTKDHKIIFAGNPISYSDDRTLPSLFDRQGGSITFDPLPPAYIYQRMLLPLFGNDTTLAETICRPILDLNQYLNGLIRNTILLTPRELIMITQLTIHYIQQHPGVNVEEVAKYFAYKLSRQFVPADHIKEFEEQFSAECPDTALVKLPKSSHLTLTDSNNPAAQMLTDFLQLRQMHIDSPLKLSAPGLGGITIEGEPGLGKTELAIACLRAQGFAKRSLEAEDEPDHQNYFYHIPAGMNVNEKEALLKRAFRYGLVVLSDEINTAASLEGLLNRLLMSKGPNGEEQIKPGFMLIGTQNPTTMAGRHKTSTALLHRMHYLTLPHYTEIEMKMILREKGLPDRRINALIEQYQKEKIHNEAVCFRDVIVRADADLKALLGKAVNEITSTDLLQLTQSEESHAEVLETVLRHKLCDDDVKLALVTNLQADSQLLKTIVEESENIYSEKILQIALKHPHTNDSTLIYIAKKIDIDIEIANILLTHSNCSQHVLQYFLDNHSNPTVLQKIAVHSQCSTIQLETIINQTHDIQLIKQIATFPKANTSILINILEKCHDRETLQRVLNHYNCNASVLLKMISLTDDDEALLAVLLHKEASARVLQDVLERGYGQILMQLTLMHPCCNDKHLAIIINKISQEENLIAIIEHPQCSIDNLHSALLRCKEGMTCIALIIKKIYQSGSFIDFTDLEILARPFVASCAFEYIEKTELLSVAKTISDSNTLLQLLNKADDEDKPIFIAILEKNPSIEVLRKIVEKTNIPEVFQLVVEQTADIITLDAVAEKTKDNNVLLSIFKKNRNPAPLQNLIANTDFLDKQEYMWLRNAQRVRDAEILTLITQKAARQSAVIKTVRQTNDSALLLSMIKKIEIDSDTLINLLQFIQNDTVFEYLLDSHINSHVIQAVINKIVETSTNASLQLKLFETKYVDKENAYKLVKENLSNTELLNKVIHYAELYPKKSPRLTLFSRPSTLQDYPKAAVLAMLKLIKDKYQQDKGAHIPELDTLISQVINSNTMKKLLENMWKLIRSGKIGSRIGNGRLRKGLKEMCHMIEQNRLLDANRILAPILPREEIRNSFKSG